MNEPLKNASRPQRVKDKSKRRYMNNSLHLSASSLTAFIRDGG